jgi:N-acetylmuramoyl-L-alanine amidase
LSYRIGRLQRKFGRWEESKTALQQAASTGGTLGTGQASEILSKEEFYFSAQVGAFSTASNADKLAAELRNRGYEAFVVKATSDGKMLNKVRVGKFSKKAEAEEKARQLQQDGFPTRVVP